MLHKKLTRSEMISAWSMVIICSIFYCYEYLLRISPGVMIDQLMSYFNVNAEKIGYIQQAYFWAYTPLQLVVGILVDRYRPRYLLTFAVVMCALGGFLTGATTYVHVAEFGRFLQGFGSAFAFVGAMKVAAVWLPKNKFSFVSGCITTLGFIGAMFGQIVMAKAVIKFNWHHTLLAISIAGFVLALIVYSFIRLPKDVSQSYRQRRIDIANIKLNIRKVVFKPDLWLAGLIGTCLWMPNDVFVTLWGVPFYSAIYGISTVKATSLLAWVFLGWVIGGPLQGILADRIGKIYIQMIICSLIASALLAVSIYMPLSLTLLKVVLFMVGLFSSAEVLIFSVVRNNVQERFLGMGISFINCFTMLGGTFMPVLIGKILVLNWDHVLRNGVPYYSTQNFKHAFLAMPIIVGCASISALCLSIRNKKNKNKKNINNLM